MNKPLFSLITIDLDDTLWPCHPVIQAAERNLLIGLQQQAPLLAETQTLGSLREHRMQVMRSHPEIAYDLTAVRRVSLHLLFEQYGYPTDLANALLVQFMADRNRVAPYDVVAVLESLTKNYTLTSVTNGNSDVRCTPLGQYFHWALTAAEVGAAKPAPAMFEQAMALSGIDADRVLHIGDDPVRDIQAAQQLGIASVWVNRNNQAWPDDIPPPTCIVRDFYELEHWLPHAV